MQSESIEMTKIGIIGLGMLGNAVALHLLDSGFEVTVYNRTKEKTIQAKEKGAKVVTSPKESCRKFRINNHSSKRCKRSKTSLI